MPLSRLSECHPDGGAERRLRLLAALYAGPSAPLEWLYGAVKVSWGAWLLLPVRTFATAPHLYRVVAALAPEWAWGAVFLATGAAQLAAWYWDRRAVRFGANLFGAALWAGYACALMAADARSPALAFFGPLSAFQGLAAAWLYPQMRARHGSAQGRTADSGGG